MNTPPRDPNADTAVNDLDPAVEEDIEANPQSDPDGAQAEVPEEDRQEVKDTEVQPT